MFARIVVFAIVMALLWYGWRLISRRLENRNAGSGPRKRLGEKRDDVVDLERDPETGVYRPGDEDEDEGKRG